MSSWVGAEECVVNRTRHPWEALGCIKLYFHPAAAVTANRSPVSCCH